VVDVLTLLLLSKLLFGVNGFIFVVLSFVVVVVDVGDAVSKPGAMTRS
jgi:hypothetical protein